MERACCGFVLLGGRESGARALSGPLASVAVAFPDPRHALADESSLPPGAHSNPRPRPVLPPTALDGPVVWRRSNGRPLFRVAAAPKATARSSASRNGDSLCPGAFFKLTAPERAAPAAAAPDGAAGDATPARSRSACGQSMLAASAAQLAGAGATWTGSGALYGVALPPPASAARGGGDGRRAIRSGAAWTTWKRAACQDASEMKTATDLAAAPRCYSSCGASACRRAAAWWHFSLALVRHPTAPVTLAPEKAHEKTWALRPQRESTARRYA